MASQYDSIKTAEELLKEVAAHGLSTKPEDIWLGEEPGWKALVGGEQ